MIVEIVQIFLIQCHLLNQKYSQKIQYYWPRKWKPTVLITFTRFLFQQFGFTSDYMCEMFFKSDRVCAEIQLEHF